MIDLLSIQRIIFNLRGMVTCELLWGCHLELWRSLSMSARNFLAFRSKQEIIFFIPS